MKINIYTSLNGVGLERDYLLMKDILTGHDVVVSDYKIRQGATDGAIAFHLEVPRFELMRLCPINIILPNAEWFAKKWLQKFKKFDEVWCKTQDAVNIFSKYHKNCVHTGFISEDLYNDEIKYKDRDRLFIHIAGQSTTKGTQALVQAYKDHKDLPKCFLISSNEYDCQNNLKYSKRLDFDDLKLMMNSCLFHICTSEYEGWGHYIHEALSCKAIVLTTDSAPMNEFGIDSRCLVPEYGLIPMGITNRKLINSNDLANKIKEVSLLSDKELIEIGDTNRQGFLDRSKQFKKYLLTYIKSI